MSWWDKLLRARTDDWVFTPIADESERAVERRVVEPETAYLGAFLRSMRIVDVRRGLSRFYGAVSSTATVPHRGGAPAEFFVVTTPTALRDVDAKQADRVLVLDRRILGPVPYRGGDLELELGLFSVRSADLAGPYLDLLESMASAAGLAFVGPALALAKPLRDGLELLVGADGPSMLEIGLAKTFSPPQTGTYCLLAASRDTVDTDALVLDAAGTLLHRGQPVRDQPYVVVTLDAHDRRDDWSAIPALVKAHEALAAEVRTGNQARVGDALAVFRRAAVLDDDLLAADGLRLAEKVAAEVAMALGTTPTAAVPLAIPSLAEVPLYG
ncbi:MAG TPA: hypothetical protein VFJ85_03350 [Acidimicrobiales bacterium]|nr:hypothetical protein [Acidimicrobiales bacterium]